MRRDAKILKASAEAFVAVLESVRGPRLLWPASAELEWTIAVSAYGHPLLVKCALVKNSLRIPGGKWNGYVAFAERPVQEWGYGGILEWVTAGRGLTWASSVEGTSAMVYGFDTLHAADEDNPMLHDENYMMHLVEMMAVQIVMLSKLEKRFLDTPPNKDAALHEVWRDWWADSNTLQRYAAHGVSGWITPAVPPSV